VTLFHSQIQKSPRQAVADVFLRIKAGKVLPDDFGSFVTFGSLGSCIPAGDPTIGFEHEHGVVLHTLNEQPEGFFSLVRVCFGQEPTFSLQASAATVVFAHVPQNISSTQKKSLTLISVTA
jgi:hypothetical protein